MPSGNFGNVLAGHIARMMGLPIRRLVVATNENDVLDEFFRTGRYRVRGTAETWQTSSPSMDISKASNFERFVFDLLGRDGAARGAALARSRAATASSTSPARRSSPRVARLRLRLRAQQRMPTASRRSAPRPCGLRRHGRLRTRPTACSSPSAHREAGVPMVCLETALPVKFAETIREALGREPERPAAFEGIELTASASR